MRELPHSPVTRAEAKALGWTDAAITRAVRSRRLVRLRHGLLAAVADIDEVTHAAAAARSCAGSVASHGSALALHGLPVVGAPPRVPELTLPPRMTGRLVRAHLHRATLPARELAVVNGVPVTSVARTLIDVARSRPTLAAVAALDAALHRGLVTVDELDEVVLRCWNWPRVRRVHRALDLVDERSESPLESVSRVILRWLRLPSPDLQTVVLDPDGIALARLDFYWDEFGVAGEADGRSKYDDRTVLTAEKRRQEAVEDLGLVVVRWGWDEVVRRPQDLRRRITSAFERGQLRDRSGFRRRWSVPPGRTDHLAREPDRTQRRAAS